MKNLKHLLKKPLRTVPISIAVFILVVALIGFADSAFLTIKHFQGIIPPCSVTAGCEVVLTSVYASLFGIPTALIGALYYLLVMVGSFAYIESRNISFLKWAMLLTILGFGASMIFVYLQVFVLGAYCPYCLVSVVTSTLLFAAAMDAFARYQVD